MVNDPMNSKKRKNVDKHIRRSVYISKRQNKEYIVTAVMIEREIWEKLLEVGPKIYGVSRGWLSPIINEALRLWLLPRSEVRAVNPPVRLREKFNQVRKYIAELRREADPMNVKDVLEHELETAIANVIGSDPRTVDKYKKLFLKHGLLKIIGGRPGRFVYEVLS